MNVKMVRTGLGLTQAEFAARIGVTHAYVGHLETGVRKPSLKLAAKIERVTGAKGLVTAVAAEKVATAQEAAA